MLAPRGKNFFKTLWEKEKMLVTNIFSFSTMFSTPLKDKFMILSNIYFVIYKMPFRLKDLSFGTGLNNLLINGNTFFYQTTNC